MINLGDKQIKDIYLGSKKIKEAYLGSKLVYKSNYFYIQKNLNLTFNALDANSQVNQENLIQFFLVAHSKFNNSKTQEFISQDTTINTNIEFPIDNITDIELHILPYSMSSITAKEYQINGSITCTIDYNYTLCNIVTDANNDYYSLATAMVIGEKLNTLDIQWNLTIPTGTNTVDGLNIPSLTFSEVDSNNKVVNKIFSIIFDQKLG